MLGYNDSSRHSASTFVVILKNATDWPDWQISLSSRLKKKRCYGAIKPFPCSPSNALTEESDLPASTASADLADQAHGYVTESVDRSLWCVFGNEEDPRKVIQALYDFFFTRTGSNLVALTTEFNELVLTHREKVVQFIARIDRVATSLQALGGPVSEHQLKARLRAGTKHIKEWNTFFALQDMKEAQGDALQYPKLCQAARLYETNIELSSDRALSAIDKANQAPAKPLQYDPRFKNMTCDRCHEKGHKAAVCLAPAPVSRKTEDQRGCYECGEAGHFKRDCPKIKNKTTATDHVGFAGTYRGIRDY